MDKYHVVDTLGQRRFVTDKPMLIFYLSLFSTWIATIVYAFCAGDSEEILPKNYANYYPKLSAHEVLSYVFDSTRVLLMIGYALLAGGYASFAFIAMRWIPNFSKTALLMVWMPLVSTVASMAYQFTPIRLYVLAGSLLGPAFVFALIRTEWFHLTEKILQESCEMILSIPVAILFSFGCLIACFLLLALTLAVQLFLSTATTSFLGLLATIVNVCVGFWTIAIVFVYMQTVLCGTFATWFWTVDKANLRRGKILLGRMMFTAKYHIGTLAYSTSIFGVIHTLVLLLAHSIGALMNKFNATTLLFIVYNLFDAIAFRFVTFSAILKCAVEGKSYGESAKNSLNTLENHPRPLSAVAKITELSLLFALTIIMLLMGLSFLGFANYFPSDQKQFVVFMVATFILSAVFVTPLFALLSAAYYTILHCFVEDVKIHDGSEVKPYAMSRELQSVINHTGPPRWFRRCSSDVQV